ncbi:ATP synthase F1 subunit epsilon [Candidatus Kuenenbacteria bacterium CG_4_9_14_3_um_filter_39_14]|uniref:ATP synthase epsilon chain n=5 Tax=Candidatus Kueneniibacteriota TaxID=1752740 RepID=A0A2M7IL01_9BACT|nr:ATP synthase F1 subunit epsilon [Candidatus Kuenenbacteria bacterium]OIP56704.1 MAG: ATP synthase F1 subunit epsilon [Candidatus Kuenenbacteria bacterium CG2_30_39_24]PIW95481.1 MAG: ATP synthase F1 subunit epsilon [Candidatus Kuenenbacteria bacterium CG_4_8_14_3_um_filter_39_15]PIX92713.1 MAG: ATP synthase F1 subunit epsilon [Candidatus Kuenenbacteria bacterium CG_4_10_14_3_um_filter_39_14]PJA91891.1 MAG: ATP synthase F1 subunit epsilon [Candidatus Kuenenbacteria bacterium CG_4_9_14_3_um_fi
MKSIKLKIVTLEKVVSSDTVSQVSLDTKMGQITILPNHLPLVAELVPGEIIVKKSTKGGETEEWMAVSGGFVEVLPDAVVILADTAEYAAEIDQARAEEARAKAEKLLKEKMVDSKEYAYVAAKLQKELARLRVVRKRKNKFSAVSADSLK